MSTTNARVGARNANTNNRFSAAAADAAPKSSLRGGQGNGLMRAVTGGGAVALAASASSARSRPSCRLAKNQ
jgi:hypothetical protein